MKRFLMMVFVAMGLATIIGCKKENSELILGTWVNTADSFEITIAGSQTIPTDCITMEFSDN